jgi:uncharacterized membrane protein
MGIVQCGVLGQVVVLSGIESYFNINTLFIVVAVLAVLLLIALAYLASISSFLKNNTTNHKSSDNTTSVQPAAYTQGELVDDKELAAVITATIYSYMGDAVPADGLVVRSIRRVR